MSRWHSYYVIFYLIFFFSLIFSHFSNYSKLGEEVGSSRNHFHFFQFKCIPLGWPHGWKFKFSRFGGPGFRRFGPWAPTWRRSSGHAEAASHVPQLEGPITKNIQLCTGGLWGEKGKNKKNLKKKRKFHLQKH